MRAEASRTYEAGVRIVRLDETSPDPEADEGYTLLMNRAKDVVEQMRNVAMAQRSGRLDKAAGSAEKKSLRKDILTGPVAALVEVAKRARKDHRDIAMQFQYKPGRQSYVDFEGAIRTMYDAAVANKQLLVPYGLSEAVTVHLGELMDRFSKARELCDRGRVGHKAATQQLDDLAQDLGSIIRTLDARNRVRYKSDPQMLARWIAASTVLGTRGPAGSEEPAETVPGPTAGQPGSGAPVAGGEVRPAA